MSWNYALHQVNMAFEQVAYWYQDFMQRTEQSFQAMHQRLVFLERREAWQGPSDEQVERVLRKILADKSVDASAPRFENPHLLSDGECFVQRSAEELSVPKVVPINMAALQVDITAMPSAAYQETLEMLESDLVDYPHVNLSSNTQKDSVHNDPN